MADPRFRDSMRLIEHYSLLPFMTPRQFYYPLVVLQFYHSMTSRRASSPLELRFTIDDRPGVLRVVDISAVLGLQTVQANSGGYRAGLSRPSGRCSTFSPETPHQDLYYSGGSLCLRCSSTITCLGPTSSHFSITYSIGEPS